MNRKLPGMKSNSTVVRVPRFKRQGNEEQFEIRTAKRVPVPKFSKKEKLKSSLFLFQVNYHTIAVGYLHCVQRLGCCVENAEKNKQKRKRLGVFDERHI